MLTITALMSAAAALISGLVAFISDGRPSDIGNGNA
jgi:hypothetical protein